MNIKTAIYSILFVSSVLSTHAYAARSHAAQAAIESTTFTSAAVVGAVAAGPVGLIVGALGGSYLAQQTRNANERALALQVMEEEKIVLAKQKAVIAESLDRANTHMQTLETQLADSMDFQVLFGSGKDTLTEADELRITQLAGYLKKRPYLAVSLSGHTDPRGTDEYNNVLSLERARSIEHVLVTLGIDTAKIQTQGHGATKSGAPKDDWEAYRLERRVEVQIIDERMADDTLHSDTQSHADALSSL